mmetsp:Transcript_24753/g.53823  ORF Transcript_24753/g.53823 Transcript_24753/m.53823 type:complete len:235 (-) Transcript_24753:1695-2399(-)
MPVAALRTVPRAETIQSPPRHMPFNFSSSSSEAEGPKTRCNSRTSSSVQMALSPWAPEHRISSLQRAVPSAVATAVLSRTMSGTKSKKSPSSSGSIAGSSSGNRCAVPKTKIAARCEFRRTSAHRLRVLSSSSSCTSMVEKGHPSPQGLGQVSVTSRRPKRCFTRTTRLPTWLWWPSGGVVGTSPSPLNMRIGASAPWGMSDDCCRSANLRWPVPSSASPICRFRTFILKVRVH